MKRFTKDQALAVMGFTGVTTLAFSLFHKEAEERLQRPIFTHEFANPKVVAEIKEAYRADFIELCKDYQSC